MLHSTPNFFDIDIDNLCSPKKIKENNLHGGY
jgi:hypothetical protein